MKIRDSKAKILFLDIETSFKVAGVWDRFNQNISMDQLIQDTYVLTWAAKWAGTKNIMVDAIHHHKTAFKKNPRTDKEILKTVWKLLDEADYVVAHNGTKFDIPLLYSRFIQQGMKPPKPFGIIDTLYVARRSFKFTSNRLDDLAKSLGVGGKIHTDFSLWKDIVLKSDKRALDKMLKYNIHDIVLLEGVYKILRSWDSRHPAIGKNLSDGSRECNACGSPAVRKNGFYRTASQIYQSWRCNDCSHTMRSAVAEKSKNKPLRSI